MNGFILRSLAIALATSATAAPALAAAPAPAAAQAPAGRLSKSVPVSLTILPGAQTSFAARGPAGSRFAVTDDGGRPVDLTDVHVYVRQADGSEARYVDTRSAEAAIVSAQRASDGPVLVTLVF